MPKLDPLARMRRRGMGIVEADDVAPGSPLSHVIPDSAGAVQRGVDHLVAFGHRRIASLGTWSPPASTRWRSP